MNSNSYATIRKYPHVELANDIIQTLTANEISYKLIDNSPSVNITFSGDTLQNEVELKIKQSDFETVNKLLDKEAKSNLDQVEQDYYLFDFSDEELFEIILKHDEWSALDYQLAKRILEQRGNSVNEQLISNLKKQRIQDLSKPESSQIVWVTFGYISAILGGLIGMFIGWYLWSFKKTLPDGQKVNAYSARDQKHGKAIFFIGIAAMLFWLSVRLFGEL